jgi:hypothetical protein
MIGLNKNGRKLHDHKLYKKCDPASKALAIKTLKLKYPEPRYTYKEIENFQFGDILMTDTLTGKIYLVEVESRNDRDFNNNLYAKYPDVNIPLKNNSENLHTSGHKGFCISINMEDFGKDYASAFYITSLKDISTAPKKKSPNKYNEDEFFYKLKNNQVKRYVFNSQTGSYNKIKLIKGTQVDYYN